MRQNNKQQSIWLVLAVGLVLSMMLTGCDKDKPGSDGQAITGSENVKVNAEVTGGTDVVRKDCQYRDIYGTLYIKPNCHAFAWQCDIGVPTTLPYYSINSNGETKKFYEDQHDGKPPCFIPSDGQEEDKVVYTNDHSAVVYSTNPLMLISYCMSYAKPRIHRKDDPAGIYIDDPKNHFGEVLAYYHYHDKNIKGGIWSGDPIRAFYNNQFAVEVDGTNYTAYMVNNQTTKFWYYWYFKPYNSNNPKEYSSSTYFWVYGPQAVYSKQNITDVSGNAWDSPSHYTYKSHQNLWSFYPDATQMYFFGMWYGNAISGPLYIYLKIDKATGKVSPF